MEKSEPMCRKNVGGICLFRYLCQCSATITSQNDGQYLLSRSWSKYLQLRRILVSSIVTLRAICSIQSDPDGVSHLPNIFGGSPDAEKTTHKTFSSLSMSALRQ